MEAEHTSCAVCVCVNKESTCENHLLRERERERERESSQQEKACRTVYYRNLLVIIRQKQNPFSSSSMYRENQLDKRNNGFYRENQASLFCFVLLLVPPLTDQHLFQKYGPCACWGTWRPPVRTQQEY